MEGLHSKMKANGTNIDNEPSHRLPTRPKGMLFEDHNSLLVSSSQQRKGSTAKALKPSKFKPSEPSAPRAISPKRSGRAATRSPSKYGTSSRSGTQSFVKSLASSSKLADLGDVSDESDDEFDLLSSQPRGMEDPATYQQPVSSSQDLSKASGHTDKKGVKHAFDPRYPPTTVLKNLKFTKNKARSDSEGGSSAPSQPTSSIPTSEPPLSKENAGSSKIRSTKEEADNDTIYVKRTTGPLETKSAIPNRNSSSSTSTRSIQPSSSLSRLSQSRTLPDIATTKVAGTRPRPKPVGKAKVQLEESKTRPDLQSEKGASSSQPRPEGTLNDLLGELVVDPDNDTPRGTSQERSRSKSPPRGRNSSPKQSRTRKAAPPPWLPSGTPRGSSPPAPRRKAQPAAFPMDTSPAPSEDEESSRRKTRSLKREPAGSPTKSRKPAPFPMAMFPDAKGKGKDTSQLTSKTRVKSSKQRSRISESPPDSDNRGGDTIVVRRKPPTDKGKAKETRSKPQLQEFPMSTQMLASIDSSPISGGKRSSEGGSDDERRWKKSRKHLDVSLASPTREFDDEGDSMMLLAPNVDPKTLCPFCDTPLPSNPSPLLLRILNSVRKKASRDPRPSNPLGLKAPITVFVAACQRHRFESQILPEAEAKGWPKSIEWTEVAGRVARMKNSLQALIEDPGDGSSGAADDSEGDEDDEWEVLFSGEGKGKENEEPRKRGAKARSIFWQEIMDVVKAKGLWAVTGVRGQFSSFEKAQPGYYGEQGSVIITQTLYNMFPLSSIDPTLVAPLTANEFVQRVLVPEVALRLIMEDNDLKGKSGKQDALVILRESSAFGVAMFPEDGGDWGDSKKQGDSEMGVGDMIVMERARKRRKELEEEQRREDEQMQAREVEKEKQTEAIKEKKPVKPRPRRAEKEKESSVEVEVVRQVALPSRPRPRPIPRSATDMNIPDVLKGRTPFDTLRRHQASRSRSRSTSTDVEMGSDSGIETTVEISESDGESDLGYRAGSVERRRSPSASETGRRPSVKPSSSRSRSVRNLGQIDISSSQTDASSTAVVNGGLRITRSRSRSVARSPARNGYGSERMAVDQGSDSDEVEVVEQSTKTPVQKRTLHRRDDNDDTPKASKPDSMSFQPLRAAQERRSKKATSRGPENREINGRPSTLSRRPTPTENYAWLLDEGPSSQEV